MEWCVLSRRLHRRPQPNRLSSPPRRGLEGRRDAYRVRVRNLGEMDLCWNGLLVVSPSVLATTGSDAIIRTLAPIPHRRKPQLRPKRSSRSGRADFWRPALDSALRLAVVPDLAWIYRFSISEAPELRRPRRRSTAALTSSISGSRAKKVVGPNAWDRGGYVLVIFRRAARQRRH